jgi:aldehyde dehydrogenase (NAD+)
MEQKTQFYIDGQWVDPIIKHPHPVINPATEKACAEISLGSEQDVELAANAAHRAFRTYSQSSREQRIEIFEALIEEYKNRYDDLVEAIIMEMGAPRTFAKNAQVACGLEHLETALKALRAFEFEEKITQSTIVKEPIGVCGLITPWNWPLNQVTCKVAPALATGCTMILKPSEISPLSAIIFAEIIDAINLPAGVFNLINGDGEGVGSALASHPLIDMVSFTGSTRAGALVAKNAAPTIKRVTQELGGKSANIILDDADFEAAVTRGCKAVFSNTGQTCSAPTRMLVPSDKLAKAEEIAKSVAETVVNGDPQLEDTTMGPLVSQLQFERVQTLIQKGLDEGAKLVCGGSGKPDALPEGYFVKPTVFSQVSNSMSIAQEEIFGPVLSIIPYQSEEEALSIANDSPYGLAGYIQGTDPIRLNRLARQIRAGNININGDSGDYNTPFGGYKQSGNGREWGAFGFEDYLEIKAISGLYPS